MSAILGGLAFTAATALLAVAAGASPGLALDRAATTTGGAAVASSASLVVAALTWSSLASRAARDALLDRAFDPGLLAVSRTATVAFFVGLVLFFVALGASGWIGSRRLGLFTTATAIIAGAVSLRVYIMFLF